MEVNYEGILILTGTDNNKVNRLHYEAIKVREVTASYYDDQQGAISVPHGTT